MELLQILSTILIFSDLSNLCDHQNLEMGYEFVFAFWLSGEAPIFGIWVYFEILIIFSDFIDAFIKYVSEEIESFLKLILNFRHAKGPKFDQLLVYQELLCWILVLMGEKIMLQNVFDQPFLGIQQLCIDQISLKFFGLFLQMILNLLKAVQLLRLASVIILRLPLPIGLRFELS